jgi:hypothetical protein
MFTWCNNFTINHTFRILAFQYRRSRFMKKTRPHLESLVLDVFPSPNSSRGLTYALCRGRSVIPLLFQS